MPRIGYMIRIVNFVVMKIQPRKSEDEKFVKVKHEVKTMFVHYKNAAALVKKLNYMPEKNTGVYIWLQGNFIFGDFIVQFITENNIELHELTIITLSIARNSIEALDELIIKGYTDKINLVLSEYYMRTEKIKQTKTAKLLNTIIEKNKNFNLFTTETHQKIVLLHTKNGNKIIFHGSANMKGSQNFEQLMIDNNDELYDFNYKTFKKLTNGK